jgi:hypothetical protein
MSHRVPVSLETSHDPINRMRVFQLATALIPDAYQDAKLLQADPITAEIAGQLYAAVSSIEGHTGEGRSAVRNSHMSEFGLSRRSSIAVSPGSAASSIQPVLHLHQKRIGRMEIEEIADVSSEILRALSWQKSLTSRIPHREKR